MWVYYVLINADADYLGIMKMTGVYSDHDLYNIFIMSVSLLGAKSLFQYVVSFLSEAPKEILGDHGDTDQCNLSPSNRYWARDMASIGLARDAQLR